MPPVAVELCAGAGGQALGLEAAGFEHHALFENDKSACATLIQNRKHWNVIEHDLFQSFDWSRYKGIDLLAGGLPCPPFSVAGKQLGERDERKPRTRTAIHFGYRRWLGWIAAHHPKLLTADPRTRVTPETVRAYAAHLRLTCRERAVATQVNRLYDALRYMYPTDDWTSLREIKGRLERAIPKAGRNPIVTTSQAVVDASLARLDEVDAAYDLLPPAASRKTRQALALRYRDGLLMAVASFFPLRRSNLAGLMIGSTLRRRGEAWCIHIPAENAKNGEPLDAELPIWISERIDRFLERYRPLIQGNQRHSGLWASAKGQPATGDAIYCAFQKEAKASLGLDITLHDARRIASTTWAIHDPVNAAGAKDLLGDRSDRVFAQHYNLANGIQASRAMAEIVDCLKKRRS